MYSLDLRDSFTDRLRDQEDVDDQQPKFHFYFSVDYLVLVKEASIL